MKPTATKIDKSLLPKVDFSGVWRNQLGSEMELHHSGESIKGKYRTAVGKPSPHEEFELQGFGVGDLIVFVVNFGDYGSVTSWSGQHSLDSDGNHHIQTLWHLARPMSDEKEPTELWSAILAGSSLFCKVSSG